MEIGKRIIFDKLTGKVLNDYFGEMMGSIQEDLRPIEIDFIDLPYGDTTLKDADTYHVDITTRTIVVDSTKTTPTTPTIPSNTLETQITELNDNQLSIMSAIADLYEAITPV